MFEFLYRVISGIVAALPDAIATRSERKAQDISVQLHLLYVRVNSVVNRGGDLLRLLEQIADPDPAAKRPSGWEVSDLLGKQRRALREFADAAWPLMPEASLVGGQPWNKVMTLLGAKTSALDALDEALREGRVPLDIAAPLAVLEQSETHELVDDERRTQAGSEISATGTPAEGWDEAARVELRAFLAEIRPRETLLALVELTEQFRAALLASFTAEELLPRVGQRGFEVERLW
jgi:hypothetical protein